MQLGNRFEIVVQPGTNPEPDSTEASTLFYTATSRVRFRNGKLRSIGGWASTTFANSQTILGYARTLYSYRVTKDRLIIGTNTRLYSFQDGNLYNITPVKTGTVAIANSLATNYTTLGSNPFTTVNGSKTVTVTHTAHKLQAGDSITYSGVGSALNGIPAAEFNTTLIVRSVVNANSYTIMVSTTAATSSGSGGGGSVIEKTAIITVTASSHGLLNGDRVKIAAAASTGGIPNTEINAEQIIRNVATNTFDIVLTTKATSSVSGGGGASTTYQKPIDNGAADFSLGLGYGGGLYGVGLYGTAKTFASAYTYPRIWSVERFGNDLILCAGGGTGVVIWQNATATAPAALSGAPTSANWIFVTHNAVAVLGAGGVENNITISDIGDATNWTPSPDSFAFTSDIEGIGALISQAKSRNIDLLFTENEVFILRYVDFPNIWDIEDLLASDGIIAPRARIEIEDAIFWMGQDDFYLFDGTSISSVPNNTLKKYIYENLNWQQRWKIFCYPNTQWDEVSWFFPTGTNTEPNQYATYNYKEKHWTLGILSRTAAEEPYHLSQNPYLIQAASTSVAGKLYRHEYGTDDDGSPLDWYAETNYAQADQGDLTMNIVEIIPDGTQVGSEEVTIYTKLFPQATTERTFGPYTIDPTTTRVSVRAHGRQRKYRFEQDATGSEFIEGRYYEVLLKGTPR